LSSRSSTRGMSCSSRDRSRSCARSSASAAAPSPIPLYSAAIRSSKASALTCCARIGTPSARRNSANAPAGAPARTMASAAPSPSPVTATPLALANAYDTGGLLSTARSQRDAGRGRGTCRSRRQAWQLRQQRQRIVAANGATYRFGVQLLAPDVVIALAAHRVGTLCIAQNRRAQEHHQVGLGARVVVVAEQATQQRDASQHRHLGNAAVD